MKKTENQIYSKDSEKIRSMFSKIAPTYDFLNHFLSLYFDKSWRKKALRAIDVKREGLYLDLCCGTFDFGIELLKKEKAKIIGLDFSMEMLKIARKKRKAFFINGDALYLPFKNETFDGVLVSFGIRNFEDLNKGIAEIRRVLKKGGFLLILEFPKEVKGIFSFVYKFYFYYVLPWIGFLISKDFYAYRYLPKSTETFLGDEELFMKFKENGFKLRSFKKRTFGILNEILFMKS